VISLTQQLQTAQTALTDPTSGYPYQTLYQQSQTQLGTAKSALATLTTSTNQQIAQLKNTSATTIPVSQLWKILLSRQFGLS
jgi:hypothetical protein